MTAAAETPKAELKPFVGYCRLEIVDSDGIPKKTVGTRYQVPIQKTEKDDNVEIVALFPPRDPVNFLRMANDSSEILSVKLGSKYFTSCHKSLL